MLCAALIVNSLLCGLRLEMSAFHDSIGSCLGLELYLVAL